MAKKRKATKPAKTTGKTCEHCGITTGRGKRHKDGCPSKVGKASGGSVDATLASLRQLKTKELPALIAFRGELDSMIAEKAKAWRAMNSKTEKTLKSLGV